MYLWFHNPLVEPLKAEVFKIFSDWAKMEVLVEV